MLISIPASASPSAPTSVWAGLTRELKERAIQSMAQMALNFAIAQFDWFSKESDHAQPAQHPQNPT